LNKLSVRVNQEIRAPEVRVLSEEGKQVGVMKLGEALSHAKNLGVDLIEIVPNAVPPVVKAIDIGKYRYQEEKKARELVIGDADFETRIRRIEEFLGESNKIRIVVVFSNKQLGAKEHGYKVLQRILTKFEGRVVLDMDAKFFGRHLAMVISPYKKGSKKTEESKNAESKNEQINN